MESTGISGRLPVLSSHVNEAQSAAQVTWNTWPGVVGVLALNPPTAAYPTGRLAAATEGSRATPSTGRRGTIPWFPAGVQSPVRQTQLACDAVPVPRLNPIQALASF